MPVSLYAQQVIEYPEENATLKDRFAWATASARQTGSAGFYVGYQISKFMHKDAWVGRLGGEGWAERKSLYELLGKKHLEETLPEELQGKLSFTSSGVFHMGKHEKDDELYLKDLGVLLYFPSRSAAPVDLKLTSMSLGVELKQKPLVWLAKAGDEESIAYLSMLFERSDDEDFKSDLLSVVSMHQHNEARFDFLSAVLASNEVGDIREDAVFWLGQLDLPQSLSLLKKIVRTDQSIDVREKAVFSLGQMSLPAAQDELINLAHNAKNRDVKKQAIFWLGQQASKKAAAVLEDMIFDEDDTKVQEYAVHALSQIDSEESIPKLIEIAKTHPNVAVRKKAIFWLGDSGDPRAVDVLIELAQRN